MTSICSPITTYHYRSWDELARRTIDVVVAAMALLVLGIVMLGIVLAVRHSSPGPALFRQHRVGYGGRSFVMYKFRTMHQHGNDARLREIIKQELSDDAAPVNGSYKIDSDPRITPVGALLRRTSLDELPQLLNVLRGEMTLVGPRPCLVWEAEMFPPEYQPRFSVVPGLTGLWQVSGRSTMSTKEMLKLDVSYVRNRSLSSDMSILLRTVPTLLRQDGAR